MKGVNWGCLLVLLVAVAVDVLAILAIRALVTGLLVTCGVAVSG